MLVFTFKNLNTFSTLAGTGAREWAKKNGIPVTQSESLLTGTH